jgi:hypothetical protein
MPIRPVVQLLAFQSRSWILWFLSGPACSSPAKRKKYLCKYQKAWEAEFSWLSHSDRSINDAYCILCKSHLSIGSGAKNDQLFYSSKNCLVLLQTKTLILISFEPSPAAYGFVTLHALSGHSLHRILCKMSTGNIKKLGKQNLVGSVTVIVA